MQPQTKKKGPTNARVAYLQHRLHTWSTLPFLLLLPCLVATRLGAFRLGLLDACLATLGSAMQALYLTKLVIHLRHHLINLAAAKANVVQLRVD